MSLRLLPDLDALGFGERGQALEVGAAEGLQVAEHEHREGAEEKTASNERGPDGSEVG